MKVNDNILQLVTMVATVIIITFSIYLFFAGGDFPGGGFIGGLVTASAFILLYLAFDIKTVHNIIAIDFKIVATIGVMLALLTGVSALIYNEPFLTQSASAIHLPIFGETQLTTALLFDLGVYLTVVGTTVTIVVSISEDKS